MTTALTIKALDKVPMIGPGDDLATIIVDALADNDLTVENGDVLVLAQKIVSKSEGRLLDLNTVLPSKRAEEIAHATDKDPRLVEAILAESKSVLRRVPGVLITEHLRGWIMANAGIDASNVASSDGEDNVLLLPLDPDKSCEDLCEQLYVRTRKEVGVLINDSFGRPWRLGTTGVALGAAGLPSLWDRRGEKDMFGRELQVSQQAVADELAAAASLVQGQGAEGRPIALIRGLEFGANENAPSRPAADLIRDISEDLFR
ncbi:coenzyme F420-0:L-glutamate ligase [Hoeflea poritis]|uniref:Coenzyme F420-0:L-glutamate ligase n=1 Tax=Hoeflea poritis TaxID=2993659 RepID=A0ABT4VXK3_9HYPH|nr:coenzyme F420-0:L-glutamate ligase [Hoeflea poritis]MDA4848767.1 coenzyme F420-0:L-glutamate ligase [Hoeflea poritis]